MNEHEKKQCKALTKAKKQCRNPADASGYCHVHRSPTDGGSGAGRIVAAGVVAYTGLEALDTLLSIAENALNLWARVQQMMGINLLGTLSASLVTGEIEKAQRAFSAFMHKAEENETSADTIEDLRSSFDAAVKEARTRSQSIQHGTIKDDDEGFGEATL